MYARYAKRLFTRQAIEKWFDRLTQDWERAFSKEEIEAGRRLYRSGEIREVELTEEDAIIHCKFDKKESYAMIDWKNGTFEVRSSSNHRPFGRAIAVAGFYEIEEIVVEEAAPSYQVFKKKVQPVEGDEPELIEVIKPPSKPVEPTRVLDLFLVLDQQGLTLNASWVNDDGSMTPALKTAPKNMEPTSKEREQVIRLAGLAHRSEFQFVKNKAVYRLHNLALVPPFISSALRGWRQHFDIRMDKAMEKRSQAIHEVDLEVVAESFEGQHASLDWRFSIEGKTLVREEGRALFKHGNLLHFIPNIGIVRVGERQGKIIREYREVESTFAGDAIPRYLLLSLFGRSHLKVSLSSELRKWHQDLIGAGKENSLQLPDFLRDYQRYGVEWFSQLRKAGCHGLLADEMGLGKTLQVVSLLKQDSLKDQSHLIVCPASVVPVWQHEFSRWFPGSELEVLRSGNQFKEDGKPTIWLSSYTQLRRHKHLLGDVKFGYVVLDEAQSIKNPDAKVSQACFSVEAEFRLALTGTPLENKQQDLWSIFRFLMPGLLGGKKAFQENLDNDPATFLPRLNRQISPFVLRRTKKEVAKELPDKVETDLLCPMTDVQKREYAKLTSEGIQELGNDIDNIVRSKNFNLLSLLTRLRQVACDPDLTPWGKHPYTDSGKIVILLERLNDVLLSGHKVVIFSQFVSFLNRVKSAIRKNLKGYPIYELKGSTTNRQKPVAEFQDIPGPGIILVSLKAGGTGITLHSADYVFLMDPWWNPAVEDQAIDRVHRIGQDKTVFVYRLITQGTIEERIMDLKASKRNLFDQVIGNLSEMKDFKSYFTKLSDLILLSSSKDD
ncbi:MAG: DEAD/DEAH box helicase [Verrucomicrobia bacterium]|nr:DEAD/DEAH box helicase [Verrucomicrobiota bacterium]MDA1065931.1 DEAD/DEAH box helicase [Verrucomicrobiota bacterium]